MRIFNTVVSVILLIAVSYLFWMTHHSDGDSPGARSAEDISNSLNEQEDRGVRIAYINTDSLVEKYDYHRELRTKLEQRAKDLEADLAQKSQIFQENIKLLEEQASEMSDEQLQAAQLDLQQSQQRLMMYRDEKAQELADEEQQLMSLIKDDMDVILDNIREEYGLDFILSYDPSSILLDANEEYNITDIVAERLNEKYRNKEANTEEQE
jgi:outer membrane protein